MRGLWTETLNACEAKLKLARTIRDNDGDMEIALRLTNEAIEEAEVIRVWATMTRLLIQAQRAAREIK